MRQMSQTENERLLRLIGAIVLASQEAEHYLKVTLPFIGYDDENLSSYLKRIEKLKKEPLGGLAGKFVAQTNSHSTDFPGHIANLVATRNQIVHHFNETYGELLNAGAHQAVFDSLETLLTNLKSFRAVLEQLALTLFEAMRDYTFRDSKHFEEFAALCATFRARVEGKT